MTDLLKVSTLVFLLLFWGCTGSNTEEKQPEEDDRIIIEIPNMVEDSAYAFVKKQVDFGPRVPGSKAHAACADWLASKFKSYGAEVTMQEFKADFHFGASADAVNIIAAINPEKPKRVLLCAHWDSRYVADKDTQRKKEAIPGADDGGSGVAVLLEIARQIQKYPLDLGVDIILFDAEDQGNEKVTESWCLGSQYWARNPHIPNYRAKYGILLDMVGSKGARFVKENTSMAFAPSTMNKVWAIAKELGHDNYFVDEESEGVVDDHYFINTILNGSIPTIDIINRPKNSRFGKYWHTHADDMSVIDKKSLGVTGNVVTTVLYNESVGAF